MTISVWPEPGGRRAVGLRMVVRGGESPSPHLSSALGSVMNS